MKALVTGGAGFIGSNLVQRLLSQGDEVWIVDNLQSGQLKNIAPFQNNPQFKFSQSDLCQWNQIDAAVKWADRIYHLAASIGQKMVLANPIGTISGNIQGCEVILEAIQRVGSKPRLLIVSTSEVYCHSDEDPDGTVAETAIMKFYSGKYLQESYPISKLVNEVMTLAYGNKVGIHSVVVRIFNTIGVNQRSTYGMVVPTFIEQALENKPLTVFGDGLQSRSFSDVRDTVRALNLLLESPNSAGQIVNVGDDRECKIIDLAHLVKKMTGSTSPIKYLNYKEAYGVEEFDDVRRRRPNLEKLRTLTGFKPQYGLQDTIESILTTKNSQN